jgi:PDZ domain-containing protein
MTTDNNPDTPETPEAPSQRRRIPKWPFVLAALLLVIGGAVAYVLPMSTNYIAFSPGTVEDVRDYVEIDAQTYEAFGDLMFLTVFADDANVFEYIEAVFDEEVDLTREEKVRPPDISREEYTRQNLESMEESKESAKYVALQHLGYESTFDGGGALITALVDDSPAAGKFESGVDVIVAVDGEEVRLAEDAVDIVGSRLPGDTLVITVEREDGSTEDVEVTLAEDPDDPERGLIGVFLSTADLDIDFPIEIEIETGNIGGPSAGLMYALGIINFLTEDDITQGHRVAGTGTIRFDGTVGPIGGVRQKVFAAIAAGAEFVLVPRDNFADAVEAADGDVEVLAIDVLDDAINFLDSLEPVPQLAAAQG